MKNIKNEKLIRILYSYAYVFIAMSKENYPNFW